MHTKLEIIIAVIFIITISLFTHYLSVKSRKKNTPHVIHNFKTEVEPDLKKSLSHHQLNKGFNLLMAKQAVASFGIWTLQLRYADIGLISNQIGDILFEYAKKLAVPIHICEKIPFWSSYVKSINDSLQDIQDYRNNILYHKNRIKNQKGGLKCFIRMQIKHLLSIFSNIL